ncbi:DUF2142 domain-containing protein [Plantibacter sp. YIM 135249]|uniref:DUF2142 domain-containing protein n=1 Tax=Plantibacter sp. YIM 135249 TaxID=3423918 RepID=UPI003D34F275
MLSAQNRDLETTAADARYRRRWLTFLVTFFAVLAPMVLWAFAVPLASAPDEASHLIRAAAVARGQIVSERLDSSPTLTRAEIPENIANALGLTCFAFKSDIDASCQAETRNTSDDLVITGGTAGLNSPVYYAAVGLPSLFLGGDAAYYGMRIMSAVLSAFAFAVLVMQLSLMRRSRWAFVGAIVGITPMALYLGGVVNPNGVEVASAGALLVTMLAMSRGTFTGRRLLEQAALALVSAVLLMSTRSISLLWLLLIALLAIFLGNRDRVLSLLRSPAGWLLLGGTGLAAIATVVWYLNPPALAGGSSSNVSLVGYAFAALATLVHSFDYIAGMIGLFGWVDTPAPSMTNAVWMAAILGLIVVALVWGRRRTGATVWAMIAVCLFVPVVTQLSLYAQYGYVWQGRYMLAMLLCLLILAGVALDDAGIGITVGRTRLVTSLFVLLAIGHVFAFVTALWRYVAGLDADIGQFVFDGAWQPPLGWKALAALFVVTVGIGFWLARRSFILACDVDAARSTCTSHSERTVSERLVY